MKKRILTLVLSMVAALSLPVVAHAAWQTGEGGQWYQNEDGSYPKSTWQWIDGNGDGVAESYYFDENGYLLTNTTTPDGYTVNESGAWVENGAVKEQTAATPLVPATQTADPKAVYAEASQKNANLGSMEMDMSIDMKMSMEGQSIDALVEMTAKYKEVNSSNLKFMAVTRISMMDQVMEGNIFYTDGYYYMDMLGQKMKMPMNLTEMMEQVKSTTDLTSMNLEYIKDAQMTTDASGNRVIAYQMDGTALMAQVNDVYKSMGIDMSSSGIKLGDITGTAVINPEGYALWENMKMAMDMTVEGETVSTVFDIKINYKNPGQAVDFELPSTDGYTEIGNQA